MSSSAIFLYFTTLGITVVFLMTESRFSPRRTAMIVGGFVLLELTVQACLYAALGPRGSLRTYMLAVHLPGLALFAWLSRSRGWKLVFQFLSAIFLCFLVHHCAVLAYVLSGRRLWVLWLAYGLLAAAVLLLVVKVIRPLYRRVLSQMRRGWWLMCLILLGHYAITVYVIPGFAGEERLATVLKPALSLLMTGVYAVFLYCFTGLQREMDAQSSAALSALKLSALQERMAAVQAAEETIRVERHDLRHRLQTAAELVRQGETREALAFLDSAQQRLDAVETVHWCRPPVLDAVFSTYFAQAQRQGISVEADLRLPAALPVDEAELAVVLANVLENAIHACMELPAPARVIRCRAISRPGLMVEVINSCAGKVSFDAAGRPVSGREGHGIGTQSVTAFCTKHGARSSYALRDGEFCFRLVL